MPESFGSCPLGLQHSAPLVGAFGSCGHSIELRMVLWVLVR